MIDAAHLISRYEALKSERTMWETHWNECADFTLPQKTSYSQQPGEKKGEHLLDNTAIQSNELLAGYLHGFLTNPAEVWFEFTTGKQELDEDDQVRRWLQDAQNRTMNVLLNTNFQTEVHEMYLDLGCFGTAPMSVEEDEKTVVRFASRPISQVVIDENARGEIDTVIRSFEWSVRDLHLMFGDIDFTDKMKDELKGSPNKKYVILHGVYPRAEAERMGLKPQKDLPFISQYVIKDEKRTLKEGGFEELPWVCPRWSKLSSEKYGRSPAMVALPEAKMINKMAETMIRGAQKVVDPPLQLPHDGFIMPLNTKPGGLNYRMSGTNDRDEIKPIFADARIDWGDQVMEGVRKRIRDAFYQNELLMSNNLPMQTATEVAAREDQKNRFLGPLLGRQDAEFLRPMIDRVFNIMLRKKMFGAPPEKLAGVVLTVRYSSAIAKVQRSATASAIQKALAASAPFIQMDGSLVDLWNGEEAIREVVRVYGAPQRVVRNRDEVEEIRKGRQAAQEQQAKLANAGAAADIDAKNAAAKAKMAIAQG